MKDWIWIHRVASQIEFQQTRAASPCTINMNEICTSNSTTNISLVACFFWTGSPRNMKTSITLLSSVIILHVYSLVAEWKFRYEVVIVEKKSEMEHNLDARRSSCGKGMCESDSDSVESELSHMFEFITKCAKKWVVNQPVTVYLTSVFTPFMMFLSFFSATELTGMKPWLTNSHVTLSFVIFFFSCIVRIARVHTSPQEKTNKPSFAGKKGRRWWVTSETVRLMEAYIMRNFFFVRSLQGHSVSNFDTSTFSIGGYTPCLYHGCSRNKIH